MSLRQWFLEKVILKFKKNKGLTTDIVSGSSAITPEFEPQSMKIGARRIIIATLIALVIAPVVYFFPQIQKWVRATTWQTATNLDSTGNVGLYASAMLNNDNLLSTVYYDKTNTKVKYGYRATGGTWTIEDIETLAADYSGGMNSDANTKFAIAKDPSDNKMSVAYCEYASGGIAAWSELKIAHRVGGGAGNCGTSNNWQCAGVGSSWTNACAMRMVSLAFATTSTYPALSYIEGTSLKIHEKYDGTNWAETTILTDAGLVYDQNQTVLKYLSNGAPIIFFVQNSGGTNYVKYTYRSTTTWAWSSPATIYSEALGVSTDPYTLSVVADAVTTDLFHISSGLGANLKYATLSSSFVVANVTTVDTGAFTWNSIMLQSNNYPAIGYYNTSGDALKYAVYNGSSWATETAGSLMGKYVSAVANASTAYPMMVSYDQTAMNAVYLAQDNEPSAPTTLYSSTTTAQTTSTNPIQIATSTPFFSAIFQDSDVGDTSTKAQIQVTTATDGFATVNRWDSGATTFSPSVAIGARSPDFKYGLFGASPTALSLGDDGFVTSPDTTYYWRIRFWDQNDLAGAWSATNTFTLLDRPAAPSAFALHVPFPYTTSANSATSTKNLSYPDNADSVVVTVSTDGATYTPIATSTVVRGAATDTITLPTDAFAMSTHYYLRAHYFNVLGESVRTDETHLNTFVEPVVTILSSTCNSVSATAIDPGFPGDSYFGFQYRDDVSGEFTDFTTNTTDRTVTGLVPGGVYSVTLFLTPVDRRGNSSAPIYGQYTTSSRLLACDPMVTANQTAVNAVRISWPDLNSDDGVYYVVRNVTTNEQVTVQETAAHEYIFTDLETGHTYNFTVQSYNSANQTSGNAIPVSFTPIASSYGPTETTYDYPPTGNVKVYQNGMPEGYATSTDVLLDITSTGAGWMQISNTLDFTTAQWLTVPSALIQKFPWKLTSLAGATKGLRSVYVKLLSKSGKLESILPIQSINVDSSGVIPPTFIMPRDYDSVGATILFSGTARPESIIEVTTPNGQGGDTVLGTATADATASGSWMFKSTVSLTEGMHLIYAVAKDKSGVSSVPAKITVYVNNSAVDMPQAPIVQHPKSGSKLLPEALTTYGVAEPNVHIVIKNSMPTMQDIDTITTDADASGKWSVTLPTIPSDGFHSYSYYAQSRTGTLSSPTTVSFRVSLEPDILPIEVVPEPVLPVDIKPDPIKDPTLPIVPIIKPPLDTWKPPVNDTPTPIVLAPLSPIISTPPSDNGSSAAVGGGGAPTVPDTTPAAVVENKPFIPVETVSELKKDATALFDSAAAIFRPTGENTSASEIAQNVAVQTKAVAKQTVKTVKKTAEVARVVAETPEVQTANKAVVVPTAAAVGVASVTTAANVPQMILYLRFLFTQPFSLINRRRRKQWGMVYNAITKMPVDLAMVRLVDAATNRIVQSRVTDRAGRYQFFAEAGKYKLEVAKDDYNFPPKYLLGKKEDGAIADLYVGAEIVLEKAGPISFNLPLDPIGVEKTMKQILKESTKKHLASLLSMTGVIVTAVSFVITPTPVVGAFLAVHVGSFFLFRRLSIGKRPKGWGFVKDLFKKAPIERAVVRIFDTQYNKLLETQVTDDKGRYGFLVGKNEYYVMAEHVGHKKFVSQTIAIKDEKEGGIVGVDIALTPENPDVSVAAPTAVQAQPPAPAQGASQYVAKNQLPTQSPKDTGLLTEINFTKKEDDIVIPEKNNENVATFSRVTLEMSKPIVAATKNSTSKLLSPVTSGSRDLIITGIEKEKIVTPKISSNGNFLDALDKK